MRSQSQNQVRRRIRAGVLTAALAGGALLGASQLGGIANAQTDETPTTETPADTAGTDDGRSRGGREDRGQEVAEVLGIETEELREQLRGGATLAEVAEENGVDAQSVIDVIVAQMSERLDRAVESGRLETAEADERRAELAERAATAVNEGGGLREGRRGGPGHRGGCDDATAADGEAAGEDSDEAAEQSLTIVES